MTRDPETLEARLQYLEREARELEKRTSGSESMQTVIFDWDTLCFNKNHVLVLASESSIQNSRHATVRTYLAKHPSCSLPVAVPGARIMKYVRVNSKTGREKSYYSFKNTTMGIIPTTHVGNQGLLFQLLVQFLLRKSDGILNQCEFHGCGELCNEDNSDWMSDDEGDVWEGSDSAGFKRQPKDLLTLLTHSFELSDSVAKLAAKHFAENPLVAKLFVGGLKQACKDGLAVNTSDLQHHSSISIADKAITQPIRWEMFVMNTIKWVSSRRRACTHHNRAATRGSYQEADMTSKSLRSDRARAGNGQNFL